MALTIIVIQRSTDETLCPAAVHLLATNKRWSGRQRVAQRRGLGYDAR